MEVFSGYFMTIKPYNLLFLCFYRVVLLLYIYIFQRFLNSKRGFSNASASYTFYPLSINREGFFSINREKIGCFRQLYAYLFLVMNKLIKTQNSESNSLGRVILHIYQKLL